MLKIILKNALKGFKQTLIGRYLGHCKAKIKTLIAKRFYYPHISYKHANQKSVFERLESLDFNEIYAYNERLLKTAMGGGAFREPR
ncbi:hypothetical protein [Helicobacter cetorum]|uniref:hypothetical protein n=1 Tax=Helicobacter cetorum TaxID=138563 RepID=UPI000CF08428|nr:hypothetical protein [Helicobacter cetorum]